MAVSVCARPSPPRPPFCLAQRPGSEELKFAGEGVRLAGMQAQRGGFNPPQLLVETFPSSQYPTSDRSPPLWGKTAWLRCRSSIFQQGDWTGDMPPFMKPQCPQLFCTLWLWKASIWGPQNQCGGVHSGVRESWGQSGPRSQGALRVVWWWPVAKGANSLPGVPPLLPNLRGSRLQG